jgi:hypothetical protein
MKGPRHLEYIMDWLTRVPYDALEGFRHAESRVLRRRSEPRSREMPAFNPLPEDMRRPDPAVRFDQIATPYLA